MPKVLFLVDQLVDANRTKEERHPGGAELTDAAAMDVCPWPLTTETFVGLDVDRLSEFDVILLGNSQSATPRVLDAIARTGRHVLFEHDLRICDWRGNLPSTRDPVHRHFQRCWCPHRSQRELFDRARGVIFLTSMQRDYYENNPFFRLPPNRILGCSLFSPRLFEDRASAERGAPRRGTTLFASPNRIKGAAEARRYCEQLGVTPHEIRGIPPDQVLRTFAEHERFVYLPIGPEWAGRMVVEARVLGCEVVVNRHVGVAQEPFWTGPRDAALEHLASGPTRFWRLVEELLGEPARGALTPRAPELSLLADVALRGATALHVPPLLFPLPNPSSAPPSVHAPW